MHSIILLGVMIINKKTRITLLILLTGLILFIIFTNGKKMVVPVNNVLENITDKAEENSDDNIGNKTDQGPKEPSNNTVSDSPETPVFTKRLNIVAIGDSITRGVGDETKGFGYVGILKDKLNTINQIVSIDNHGVTGNRSDHLLKRLDKVEIIDDIEKADIVLITIGANDILQIFKENFVNLNLDQFSDEQNEYRKRVTNILEKVKQINSNTSIYLIGFYNPFRTFFADIDEVDFIVDHWNDIGYEVTTQFDNVYYIPTKDLFTGPANTYLSEDNFHLNHNGYKKMTDRILESLIKNEGNIYEQLETGQE